MIFDVLKASSNHVKVQGWEWADMFVVCICVLQWLHIGEVIVCVCALQWFRMSFDHWVSAVCLCGPLPIGVNFSYLKWRQCGEEKRCYGVLKQEVWSGETLCERCRLKHVWHPPHWSTVTVLLWLGCQKWQTHLFFGVLRSAHVEKKRFFKMGIVETCHTHKFYRHLFFWIIYIFFPFWNFRHRLVRLYWYSKIPLSKSPWPFRYGGLARRRIRRAHWRHLRSTRWASRRSRNFHGSDVMVGFFHGNLRVPPPPKSKIDTNKMMVFLFLIYLLFKYG